jgi:hypothetical protein
MSLFDLVRLARVVIPLGGPPIKPGDLCTTEYLRALPPMDEDVIRIRIPVAMIQAALKSKQAAAN